LEMETKYVSTKEHPVKGFHDYEVFPVNPWNYGLILDKKDPHKLFVVEKSVMPANPFVQETTPVKLKVKAQKVNKWAMSYNDISAFEVPYGPVTSTEPVEEITLAPFGSENIRISTFPIIKSPEEALETFTEDFDDNTIQGWVYYGGGWFVKDGVIYAASNKGSWGAGIHGSKVIASSVNVKDFTFETDMTSGSKGDAGVVFRVNNPAIGADFYEGYYVGINPGLNRIEIGKSTNQRYVLLDSSPLKVDPEKMYKLKVEAKGASISVYLDNATKPILEAIDSQFNKGTIGLRSYDGMPSYDNIKVKALTQDYDKK
jgi:hypothetical protein